MSDALSQGFVVGLARLGLDAQEPLLLERFSRYRRELLDWNTRINLTAIIDPEEVLLKHFLDSLSLLSVCERLEIDLLDVGSGAGFPGLPLAIARPQWQVTLLEATGKKVAFLKHLIEHLELKNVAVVQGRAEELAHKHEYRSAFDCVTARAVASLPHLLECCAAYCRVGGMMILLKKGDMQEELAQGKRVASQVGVRLNADVPVDLPGLADGRRLLVWDQLKPCPAQFPRSWAAMTRKTSG